MTVPKNVDSMNQMYVLAITMKYNRKTKQPIMPNNLFCWKKNFYPNMVHKVKTLCYCIAVDKNCFQGNNRNILLYNPGSGRCRGLPYNVGRGSETGMDHIFVSSFICKSRIPWIPRYRYIIYINSLLPLSGNNLSVK